MRRLLALVSLSLLVPLGCSGDDASSESAGSAGTGTDSGQCAAPGDGAARGDQCPVTESNSGGTAASASVTDSSPTASDTSPTSGGGTGMTSGAPTTGASNTTTGVTDTATTGMTGVTDTATTGGLKCESGCDFEIDFMVTLDMCGHEPYIGLGPTETVRLTVSGMNITIEILGDPGLAPMMGTIDANGAFVVQGTGVVAGYPDTAVEWTGTVANDVFSATANFGSDLSLPGGCNMLASLIGDIC